MRLRNRIITAAAVLITVTTTLIGLMSISQIMDSLEHEDQTWSAAMANAVAKAVTKDTLARDKVAVRDVLRRVTAKNDQLAYLVVVDFYDEIFASTFSTEIPKQIGKSFVQDKDMGVIHFQYDGIRVKDITYPLIEGLDAHLHVGIKLDYISGVATQVVVRLLLGSIAILMFAIFGAFLMGHRISTPITRLANALHAYGKGKIPDKWPEFQNSGYEIRELYESFRGMLMERERISNAMQEQASQYQAVIETSGDGFWMVDDKGVLQEANDASARLSGYNKNELVGMYAADLIDTGSEKSLYNHLQEISRTGCGLFEARLRTRTGVDNDVEISASHYNLYGGVFFIFVRDISERKKSIQQQRLAAEVFKNTSEGIVITDTSSTIIDVNRAYCEIMGYTREEVIGQTPGKVKSGRHGPEFYQEMWRSISEHGHWVGEVWDRRKNGDVFPKWLSINAVTNDMGIITHYVGTFADISVLKNAEEQLQHMAYYDSLTGLPNRALFMDRLTQEVAISRRLGHKCAVLFIDLDRFKNVNDTLGHAIGDELLVEAARRLSDSVRENDTVARLGGDEFTIILREVVGVDAIALVARKIMDALISPLALMGNEVRVGGSIGIAIFPDDGENTETLIKHADAAMYAAKSDGRQQYHFYTEQIQQRAHEHLRIEGALHHAIESEQFFMVYQPQIDSRTRHVIGGEALIRWQHPELGFVAPDKFIGIAEESGIILKIGEWVMRRVCKDIKAWQRLGLKIPPIAINLSARQFRHAQLVESIAEVVHEYELSESAIELEITESVAMDKTDLATDRLRLLNDSGYSIAIDDFGTGHSSLSYLKMFPVNKLKLDRSFVADIPDDANDMAISSAVIQMAHSLGLKVVAEGVETESQLKFLVNEGCDILQGYLFSKPISSDEFAEYISSERIV